MDSEKQISLINQMLDYLDLKEFKLSYEKEYEKIYLAYNREKSILYKRIKCWNRNEQIISDDQKEKAFGGHNGNLIYSEIKDKFLKQVRKNVVKEAVRRELSDNDFDYLELGV